MSAMKYRMLLGWCAVLGAIGVASAADSSHMTAKAIQQTAEASMVVTGTVEVSPDGSLQGYMLDQPEKLPPAVVSVVDQTMKQWRFTLSGSTNEVVKSSVSMRVVAKPNAQGNFEVRIEGASFGNPVKTDGTEVTYAPGFHRPPAYPSAAIQARVSGTVFLDVRVGRNGLVEDVVAEQVNLDQYGDSHDMERFRNVLADASIKAVRAWAFTIPTHGPHVDAPYWVVRVPVNYSLHQIGTPDKPRLYGQWEGYIPGPRQTPSWLSKSLANEAPDAVADDALRSSNDGLKLATPLTGM
jgi:hypothetical protein